MKSHTVSSEERSNINFESIEIREAVFRDSDGSSASDWRETPDDVDIRIEVTLSIPEDANRIRVNLVVGLECPERASFFRELRVTLVGTFVAGDAVAPDQLRDFGAAQAPLLLWPYARQAITTLLSQTRFAGYIIPPINMQSVVRSMLDRAREGLEDKAQT